MTKLPDETRIGVVSLTVSDLERSLKFYTERLGFQLQTRGDSFAYLGAGGEVLLELHEKPGALRSERTTGLYHFAILVPSRFDLARSLNRIATSRTPVQGFADHLVSEAIYLPDPDGNGIEIYCDRPRDQWPRAADGALQMSNAPLDIDSVLAELGEQPMDWTGLHPDTTIGHMHLHVADIDSAEAFYRDVLGFDWLMRFGPSAAFFSAGGYHHHVGINTWAGVGAPPAPQDSLGLRWFGVVLPDKASLDALVARVKHSTAAHVQGQDWFEVQDPSSNRIRFFAS